MCIRDRLIRTHARSAGFLDEKSAHEKRAVANLLRAEPKARTTCVEPVLRIALAQFRREAGRLLISRGGNDEFHDLLHVSAGLDEFRRQPIEQRRMTRPFALRTEV